MREIWISPSSAATWLRCRAAWRYTYEDRLRARSESSQYAVGAVQHVALEARAKGSDPAATVEAWVRASTWADSPPSAEQISEGLRGAEETWALVGRLWPGARWEGVEEEFRLPHPADPLLVVNGKIDLVLIDGAGRRVQIDYKRRSRVVGAVHPERIGLVDAREAPRNLQSLIYAWALREQDRPVDEAYLVYRSPSGVKLLRTTPTPEALEWVSEALLGWAEEMRGPRGARDRSFPEEGSCYAYGRPCDYAALCTAEVHGDLHAALKSREDLLKKRAASTKK